MAEVEAVQPGREDTEFHLDVDPNDPRLVPPASGNSNLNEEDPEKDPQPQNVVKKGE